jgi:hypothetical protein
MQTYYNANIWNRGNRSVPMVCPSAAPVFHEQVTQRDVIYVVDAKYRRATLTGHFVLAPYVRTQFPQSGTGSIAVLSRWFGHRLKIGGLRLRVDFANVQFIANYTGPVVSDIAD